MHLFLFLFINYKYLSGRNILAKIVFYLSGVKWMTFFLI